MPACNGIGAALFALLFCGTLGGAEGADQDSGNRHNFLVSWHDGQVRLTPVEPDAPPQRKSYQVSCSGVRVEQRDGRTTLTFIDAEVQSQVELGYQVLAAKEIWVDFESSNTGDDSSEFPFKFKGGEASLGYRGQEQLSVYSGIDAGMKESAKEHQARWMYVLIGETTQPIFHRFNAALAD